MCLDRFLFTLDAICAGLDPSILDVRRILIGTVMDGNFIRTNQA